MATNASGAGDGEDCKIALEAAMGVALDHCTDEDELKENLGLVLGVEPDRDCDAALREGLDEETCTDPRGLRQWVLCRAHDLLRSEKIAFQDAMDRAWSEAADECTMADSAV